MIRLPLTIADRLHGAAVGLGLARKYRRGKGYALRVNPLSVNHPMIPKLLLVAEVRLPSVAFSV